MPLLIGVSPGRKITEKPPGFELFITPVSSDGDEQDSDFVSRRRGDPDRCIVRGSTGRRKKGKEEIKSIKEKPFSRISFRF